MTRRWTWLLMVSLGLLGGGLGYHFAMRGPAPQPPVVVTTGLEPVIAAQIQSGLDDVKRSPRSGAAWGRLGMILQAHEWNAEARHCFAQAQRFEPREPRWPYLHALLLGQVQPAEAIALLQRAADLARGQPDVARIRLAQSLFEAGRHEEATAQWQLTLKDRADHPLARLGLAELSLAQGQFEEARQRLQPCLTNVHTAQRAHTLLAQVERRLGRATPAAEALRAANALPPDPSWPDPYLSQAAAYRVGRKAWTDQAQQRLDQGRPDEARPLVARLVESYPDAPETWLLLGRVRFETGDCAGAEQALRRHLQLAPSSVNGHAQLGMALLCLERYAEAVPILQKAVQLKPDFAEAHFNLGFAQGRAGMGVEAMQSFRNAIRYSPNLVAPYITLADLLDQSGQKDEAREWLTRALQLDPGNEGANALWQRVGK